MTPLVTERLEIRNLAGARTPLLNARHKDGRGPPTQSGLTPARAEGE